jgi:hypothetical protein
MNDLRHAIAPCPTQKAGQLPLTGTGSGKDDAYPEYFRLGHKTGSYRLNP